MAKRRVGKKNKDKMPSETDLAIDRSVSTEKSIPFHEVEDWVGHVPNLHKIDTIHLWDDHFRINCWCVVQKENMIYESYSIDKSFHVRYNDGKFEDKSNPERKFDTKYL